MYSGVSVPVVENVVCELRDPQAWSQSEEERDA
jgi:hypothetical protein